MSLKSIYINELECGTPVIITPWGDYIDAEGRKRLSINDSRLMTPACYVADVVIGINKLDDPLRRHTARHRFLNTFDVLFALSGKFYCVGDEIVYQL